MDWWHALILGIVEGLTEYLPVSSTGHLLLAQRAMGIEQGIAADAFAICIQSGAILAVCGLYWKRVAQMIRGLFGQDPAGLRLVLLLAAAFLPAALIGLTVEDAIKENLFGGDRFGLWPIIAAWFAGGVAILAVGARKRSQPKAEMPIESLTVRTALVIGLIQCVAMWPGVSRSLVTIVGGLLVGLSVPAAVEFSFLLGLVTLTAATGYDGVRHGTAMLDAFGPTNLLLGLVAAWISAVVAVKWMVSYLKKHGLGIFGWYRIALALGVAGLILAGIL
jgi:undecaprenyl-diphosphatase